MKWSKYATRYSFPYIVDGEITDTFDIEPRSENTWVVTLGGRNVLDPVANEFCYEPLPSHRDDDFKTRTRFPNKESAYKSLQLYLVTWERVGPGWRKKTI